MTGCLAIDYDTLALMKFESLRMKMRNPKWNREELILTLNLYFKLEPNEIFARSSEIIEHSILLNRLSTVDEKERNNKFRNPNGVCLKLGNFLAIDPEYSGKGMKSYSKLDISIFQEFVNNRSGLIRSVNSILSKINEVESSHTNVSNSNQWKKWQIILLLDLLFHEVLGRIVEGNPKIVKVTDFLNRAQSNRVSFDKNERLKPAMVAEKILDLNSMDFVNVNNFRSSLTELDNLVFNEFRLRRKELRIRAFEIRSSIERADFDFLREEEIIENNQPSIESNNFLINPKDAPVFFEDSESLVTSSKRVSSEDLKELFKKSMSKHAVSYFSSENPFLIELSSGFFYVFLKNISPAYYIKYPDIERVQLPYSKHFRDISVSSIPFVVLGYNKEFDTFTAWNPIDVKGRLNKKSNVSLFTRKSFQEQASSSTISIFSISNGDRVVIFKKELLSDFFLEVMKIFNNTSISRFDINSKFPSVVKDDLIAYVEKEDVKFKEVIEDLRPYILKSDIVGAVLMCNQKYSNQFPDMGLNEWRKLVSEFLLKKKHYFFN
jgi:hypothetical protein